MQAIGQQVCEVKVDGAWRAIRLAEARTTYTMASKRCPACYGQIVIVGNFTPGGGYKLQHRKAHPGCSLKPETYSGVPSQHPQALS